MSRSRLLLLNQYFPPDASATAKLAAPFAHALSARFDVTVLCGRPSYEPTEAHPWYLYRREREGRIDVVRVGSTAYHRRDMRGRMLNYLTYIALAFPRALWARPDVVFSMTDPPFEGILAALVATIWRRPLVYNIQDLHPDMALRSGAVSDSLWVRVWARAHDWALRRATRIVVLGEDMRDVLVGKGLQPERIVVVRNGARAPEIVPTADDAVVQELRGGFSFVVAHAGNLGFYGAWETLLHAAERLDDNEVGFLFVGEGASKEDMMRRAAGNESVRFLPYRPDDQRPHVLAAADIHIVTMRQGLAGLVVPSKLPPILFAGRPVIAVMPEACDVARLVERHGCGVVVDPDDPDALVAVIRELRDDPDRLDRMARRAAELAPEFELDKQLRTLVDETAKAGR